MRQDIRLAIRTLQRTPLFTTVAILSLALAGCGKRGTDSLFRRREWCIFKHLHRRKRCQSPFFRNLEGECNGSSNSDSDASVFSYPFYRDMRDRSQLFTGAIARSGASADVPAINLQWMETQIGNRIYVDRLLAWLATGFGVLALGATRASILWLVLREVALLVATGLAIWIPAALLCGRYVQSQLFGLRAHDLAVMIVASAILALAALLAGYLPARRAASIDPLGALRHE